MGTVLLDTTVASFLHPKKKASGLRAAYEGDMRGQHLALCFQTVPELWSWAEHNRWGTKAREGLDAFIRRCLVIPYDFELTKVGARVMSASREKHGRFETGDCWIAATAVHWSIPLLTHDRDFVDLSIPGLSVISHLETPDAGANEHRP